jgi:hypothetical protein
VIQIPTRGLRENVNPRNLLVTKPSDLVHVFRVLTAYILDDTTIDDSSWQERLEKHALALDETLKIIICVLCGCALPPTANAVCTHLGSEHRIKQRTSPELRSFVATVIEKIPLASPEEVSHQTPGRAPIERIKVRRGFYCPLVLPDGAPCSYTAGTMDTLYQHLGRIHKGDSRRPSRDRLADYRCDYQTLFLGQYRSFFRVQTGLVDSHCSSPYSVFLNTAAPTVIPNAGPEQIKRDEIPSFLRVTRWHMFLEPYRTDSKDVAALVEYPTRKDTEVEQVLRSLGNVSDAWIKRVYSYWEVASGYIRRTLAKYPM